GEPVVGVRVRPHARQRVCEFGQVLGDLTEGLVVHAEAVVTPNNHWCPQASSVHESQLWPDMSSSSSSRSRRLPRRGGAGWGAGSSSSKAPNRIVGSGAGARSTSGSGSGIGGGGGNPIGGVGGVQVDAGRSSSSNSPNDIVWSLTSRGGVQP